MKKAIVLVFLFAFKTIYAQAQTKIFKEVGDEISSQMATIRQDNALVGYLMFTRLEKVTDDSFNYKISIMDENLNDIGSVNFKDKNMVLQDVAFEQDVLCIAYVKSKYAYQEVKLSNKEYDELGKKKDDEVFIQYLSLNGKILKTNSFPISISRSSVTTGAFLNKVDFISYLRHPVQLKNISQKGFACFYGDTSNYLTAFDTKGNILWKKQLNDEKNGPLERNWTPGNVNITTYGSEIYLVSNKYEWGHFKPAADMYNFEILGFSAVDTTQKLVYSLADEKGNQLRSFFFRNAPSTGKPCITGLVSSPKKEKFVGVCTINIGGLQGSNIQWTNSYWSDNIFDPSSESQHFRKNISDFAPKYSFRDFTEHTYFATYSYSSGSELVEQDEKGILSINSNILSEGGLHANRSPFAHNDNNSRSFYALTNSNTKTTFLIVEDPETSTIYNVTQKKVQRVIPHKEEGIKTQVYPAKDGYIMVSEYNKKEKYTKLSIEAL